MIRTTGITAVKHEPPSLASQLPIDIDQQQSIDLQYEIKQKEDITQIKRVADGDINITYPVRNAKRLDNLKLIESQFADANAISDLDPDLVDSTILSAMPYYLDEEGVDLPEDSIHEARVKALIFRQVRGIRYRTDLLEYLHDHLETARSLGFKTADGIHIGSESTLSRAATDWGIDRQSVQDAICRIRHTLFRNGILPVHFTNIGYNVNQPIPCDSQVPDRLRCQGLVNYSDLLLQQFSDISFDRGTGTTYSPREIIAALAQMALHENPSKGRHLAQWHYKSDIITIQRIQQIVSENFYRGNIMLAKSRIETLDKKLHQALFHFADDVGLFQRRMNIALDPTWVPVKDDVDDTPGAIKNPTISEDAEGGFTYPMAVSFTPMASFSLGVKYVTEKSQYYNAFRKLLSRIKDFGNIGWILADREFDSANMISLLQSAAGKKWIIRVREHHKVITKDVSQALEEVGKAQVSIGNHDVNVFSKKFTSPTHPYLEKDENMILLSDMPIEKTDPSSLVEMYMNRWLVETYIRQIKHSFSLKVKRELAPIHQFRFTIASFFYNMWAIINQSTSPMYGLPLRPQYYDVLKGIVQSTFSRRRQFHSQIDKK